MPDKVFLGNILWNVLTGGRVCRAVDSLLTARCKAEQPKADKSKVDDRFASTPTQLTVTPPIHLSLFLSLLQLSLSSFHLFAFTFTFYFDMPTQPRIHIYLLDLHRVNRHSGPPPLTLFLSFTFYFSSLHFWFWANWAPREFLRQIGPLENVGVVYFAPEK